MTGPSPGALAARRSANESAMGDRCTITRGADRPAFSKESGTTHVAPSSTVYAGRCRVAPIGAARSTEAAGEQFVQTSYTVRVPHAAPEVQVDDRITLASSTKSGLVDRELRVADVAHTTLGRRLIVVDDLG